jgi:hypothetical protein
MSKYLSIITQVYVPEKYYILREKSSNFRKRQFFIMH